MVPDLVVSGDSLSPEPTAQSMVTILVTCLVTSRAGPIFFINLASKAILDCKNKLDRLEVQAKGAGGNHCQPSTSMVEPQRSEPGFFPHVPKYLNLTLEESLTLEVNFEAESLLGGAPHSLN